MTARKQPDTRRISGLRNLGPACERDLNAVGILTAQDLIDLGVELAYLKLLEGRAARGLSTHGCNAAYLYALYGAIHDVDWREIPDRKKDEFKKLSAELRDSGVFQAPAPTRPKRRRVRPADSS